MAEKEPYKWVTVQGKHIPVYHGEDGNDVFGVGKETDDNADNISGVSVDKNGALPDRPLPFDEANEWLQKVMGVDKKGAMDIQTAFESWSNYGSSRIHNELDAESYAEKELGMATGKQEAERINKYLNNPDIPKYKGELYRGMTIRQTEENRAKIDKMLEDGVWKEPGITAFSYDKDKAELYAGASAGTLDDIIRVTLKNNKHASTIGHLSIGGGEKEALYPGEAAKKGIKIASYEKKPVYFDKFDRAHFRETGEKRYVQKILRYEYDIILEDE